MNRPILKKKGKKSKHKNKKPLALKKDKGNKSKPLKEEDVLSSKDDNDEEVSTITPISKSNDLEIIREIEIPHDSSRNQPTTIPIDYFGLIPSISNECCLICQYQAIYGTEPRQMKNGTINEFTLKKSEDEISKEVTERKAEGLETTKGLAAEGTRTTAKTETTTKCE